MLLSYSAECNANMICILIPKRFNPDPRLLRVQMGPYFGNCEIDYLKQVRPFMPPDLRPFVYHYQFALKPIILERVDEDRPNSQYANDIRLEVLIALFISQLMATYLDTVLRQLEVPNPVEAKLNMWRLIEFQMLDLLKIKARLAS
jgi:hypothetical protein